MRQCLGPVPRSRFRTFTILVSYPEPTRYVQCDIPLNIPEGGVISYRRALTNS
jgi:hypothetical protein